MLWEFGRSYSCSTSCYRLLGGNIEWTVNFLSKGQVYQRGKFHENLQLLAFHACHFAKLGSQGLFWSMFVHQDDVVFIWWIIDGHGYRKCACKCYLQRIMFPNPCFHFHDQVARLIPQQTWCKSRLSEWFLFLADPQHIFWSLKDIIPSIVWGYGEEMLDNGSVWSRFFLQLGTILIQAPTLGTSR